MRARTDTHTCIYKLKNLQWNPWSALTLQESAHKISSTAAWNLALHFPLYVQVVLTMLLDFPVVCTDFKMFQNLLKQNSIHLFLVPFIWLLIIWSNNSRMWLWQRDHFHGKELWWQDALYGFKMGKKLERSHGMYAKGRKDSWAQGGKLSWANKYCVMRTTVHLWKKSFWLSCSFVKFNVKVNLLPLFVGAR